MILLFPAAGAGLILFAAFSGGHDWRVAMNILFGGCVLSIVPFVFSAVPVGKRASLSIYLPVVLAAVICLALFLMQFATNLPLTVWTSAGAALFALGVITALFTLLRTEDSVPLVLRKRDAALAARYAGRQLRRARPALDDAWIPHIIALGLSRELILWRKRPRDPVSAGDERPAGYAPLVMTPPGQHEPQTTQTAYYFRPFTGTPPESPDADWVDALMIPEKDDAP